MAITLGEQVIDVSRILTGSDCVTLGGGEEIEIKAGSSELLKEEVPEGKKWGVITTVRIEESNA